MNNDRSEGEKVLLYHRLLDAELFYRKANSGFQWQRRDTFIIPGQNNVDIRAFEDDDQIEDDIQDEEREEENDELEISYEDFEGEDMPATNNDEDFHEYVF